MKLRSSLIAIPSLLLAACAILEPDPWAKFPRLDAALELAGENRAELVKVLTHYDPATEPLKIEAAHFLLENMEGHGYSQYALLDEEGNEVEFDALAHANFAEAMATLDRLEKEHGTLDFKVVQFTPDLEVIEAEFLIAHIDRTFEAWRTWPWAKDLSFEAICEYILPYRGSNEPLEDWRTPMMAQLAELPAQLEDPTDVAAAAGAAHKSIGSGVRFRELFYLHPTDQGYSEMREGGAGRCEDITNWSAYIARAAAIASAQDYTPHWANRDNNHAWPVRLDANGEGFARQGGLAAKIYRKTFSQQRENLAFQLEEGETAPPWLNRRTYRDVTDQYTYISTSDVEIPLSRESGEGERFAYLCVFNGGEWKAIHWGRIELVTKKECRELALMSIARRIVEFDRMGRGVAYLPAFWHEDELVPAAPPFFLDAEGGITTFIADPDAPITCELPGKEGQEYELFVWQDGWESVGRGTGGEAPMRFENVPSGGLYWLVADGSRKLERIFSLNEDGPPRFM